MKRAFGLIAATLLTTSVYSQDYSSSSSTSNPDSTPDYRSRQTESGAPPSSDSSASAGYDRAPGLSGGNSSTGQSNGSNIENSATEDQSLTTRDSDLPGSEYRGTLKREPNQNSNSELNPDSNSAAGSSGSSVSGTSSSSDETTVKGSGSADGAFHEPAAPVREGSQSEGWSSSGTFSGAGPGSVSGSGSPSSAQSNNDSSSSSNYSATPMPTEPSEDFSADVSDNAALSHRDQDLRDRGLEPDSNTVSNDELSDMLNENNNDEVLIFEDSQVVRPDENIGAPGESESGAASSSDEQYLGNENPSNSSSSSAKNSGSAGMSMSGSSAGSSDSSYAQDLYRRTQKDWSARLKTDIPHTTPSLMDRTVEELNNTRYYNESGESSFGAPGSSVSGSNSSDNSECDTHKGSAAQNEQGYIARETDLDGSVRGSGTAIESDQRLQESSGAPGANESGKATSSYENHSLRSSGSAMDSDERLQREQDRYHVNRGTDDKYHINREASGDRSETSAPGEYGDLPIKDNYDDGHLNGNNAAGSSGSYESSSSAADISRPDQSKSSPGRPQGGDENSATMPE